MKTISVTDIQTNLTNTLKESGGEPMVITENDRPIAVITSVLDPEDLERLILAHNPRFNRLIDSANLWSKPVETSPNCRASPSPPNNLTSSTPTLEPKEREALRAASRSHQPINKFLPF